MSGLVDEAAQALKNGNERKARSILWKAPSLPVSEANA